MTKKPHRPWLVLHLEAPLLSFGGVAIDNFGVTNDFPAASMLTGLFANALGWQRTDSDALHRLQHRIVFAARRETEPYLGVLRDTQNAKLEKNDKAWTTRGKPEGRAGDSYDAPHRRFRDYHPDANVIVVVTLTPSTAGEAPSPTLEELAQALDRPARPLFFGRKPCLPTRPIRGASINAATAFEALQSVPTPPLHLKSNPTASYRAIWPSDEGPTSGPTVDRTLDTPNIRNWHSGLHSGTRQIVEGRVSPMPLTSEGACP